MQTLIVGKSSRATPSTSKQRRNASPVTRERKKSRRGNGARLRKFIERTLTFPLPQDYKSASMKYLSLILALTLAACGVPEMVKPGMSQQDSAKDRFECLRASESTSSWSLFGLGTSQARHDPDVYRSCMEARGYVIDKN